MINVCCDAIWGGDSGLQWTEIKHLRGVCGHEGKVQVQMGREKRKAGQASRQVGKVGGRQETKGR